MVLGDVSIAIGWPTTPPYGTLPEPAEVRTLPNHTRSTVKTVKTVRTVKTVKTGFFPTLLPVLFGDSCSSTNATDLPTTATNLPTDLGIG